MPLPPWDLHVGTQRTPGCAAILSSSCDSARTLRSFTRPGHGPCMWMIMPSGAVSTCQDMACPQMYPLYIACCKAG
jgi:hypothetical protein